MSDYPPKHNHRPGEFCGEVECPAWRPTLSSTPRYAMSIGPVSAKVNVTVPPVSAKMTKAQILDAFQELHRGSDEAIRKLAEQITRERERAAEAAAERQVRAEDLLNQHREQASRERQRLQKEVGEAWETAGSLKKELRRAKVQVEALTDALELKTPIDDGPDDFESGY
jgi:hypothetical protein